MRLNVPPILDASELCKHINLLVDNEEKKIVRKKKSKDGESVFEKDKIKYSDFLVLVKKKDEALTYKKMFKEYNIPVIFEIRDKDVSDDPIIGRFTVLYSFLANSYDRKSIAGAMIDVLGEDFFKYSAADKNENEDKDEEWKKAAERVTALYEYTKSMSPYALAEYLSHRIDLLLPHGVINKSEMTMAVSTLRQMVDTVLKTKTGSRQALADAFVAYRNNKAGDDLSLDFEYNAVRFMNVHQAKGLEGNIVIITDIGEFDTKSQEHKYENIYYPVIGEGNYKNYTVSFNDDAKKDEKEKRKAEDERLKYVTATRAREVLIFMPPKSGVTNDGRLKGWISSECEIAAEKLTLADGSIQSVVKAAKPMQREDWERELTETQTSPVYNTLNPSLVKGTHTDKPKTEDFEGESLVSGVDEPAGMISASVDAENLMFEENDEDTQKGIKLRGDYLGTAMHRMYELIVNRFVSEGKDKTKIADYAKTAINQAIIESMDKIGEDADKYETRLKAFAGKFANDDNLLDRIAAADTVYTELPFSFFIDTKEADELSKLLNTPISAGDWVNGTADLVLVNGSTVTVLDYKSNRNSKDAPDFMQSLYEKYDGQLKLYKFAMKKLLGAERVETELVNYQTEV